MVVWGGDVILGRGIAAGLDRAPAHPLAGVAESLTRARYAIANLEGPLTAAPRRSRGPYDLRGRPEHVSVLADAGFDALGVANNHTTDNGAEGLLETIAVLARAGIGAVGGGPDIAAAFRPTILQHGGVRLAVLAVDATGLGQSASKSGAGVAPYDAATVRAAVASARRRADVVAVMVHWGDEYAASPSADERAIAAEMVGGGADIVIGTHTHSVQPVCWIGRPNRWPAFVAWSLGNLLFDSLDPESGRGVLLLTAIGPGGVRGYSATPTKTDWRGVNVDDSAGARVALERRLLAGDTARSDDFDGERWWLPPSRLTVPIGGGAGSGPAERIAAR